MRVATLQKWCSSTLKLLHIQVCAAPLRLGTLGGSTQRKHSLYLVTCVFFLFFTSSDVKSLKGLYANFTKLDPKLIWDLGP